MIHDSFLTAYFLSGDRKFLEPFQLMMDIATRGPLLNPREYAHGSKEWTYAKVVHQGGSDETSVYRWLTGERVYDEYTKRHGKPTQLYQMDHDLPAYQKSFEGTAKGLRNNFAMRTSEVIATDRAGLGGARTTFGAYTGAVVHLRDARAPTMSVTWETPDTDFAALVTESTRQRLRVWIYSFRPQTTQIGMRLWRLDHGDYVLREGELMKGEHHFQHRYGWKPSRTVRVAHKGESVYVDVPSGRVWVVDLRLGRAIHTPEHAPDLAIARRDITTKAGSDVLTVNVMVHNIGNADAAAFKVALQAKVGERWREVAETSVRLLSGPQNLEPSAMTVTLQAERNDLGERWRVVLDPDNVIHELYEANNICTP